MSAAIMFLATTTTTIMTTGCKQIRCDNWDDLFRCGLYHLSL